MTRGKNVLGCVLTIVIVAGAAYGFVAGMGFLWWGRGFAGAMAGRHHPERVRAASEVHVYDHVILVERDRVVFRRSLWATTRLSVILGITSAIAVIVGFAVRRRKAPRLLAPAVLLIVAGAVFVVSRSRAREVVVPRGTSLRLETEWYEYGGGRSGTRNTSAYVRGWQIVLPDSRTVLVRLPWNEEPDAEIWRGLIAEKLR
ncbi:MAG TPA: hypothetical protein VF883_11595 [Thermoanaerobaculia bacterium]